MRLARSSVSLAFMALMLCAAAPAAQGAHAEAPAPGTPLACLARTVYFEARGESDRAMSAVAHVILNRVEDPEFPDAVCRVVHEGGERPPCQFSWWCDGRSDVAAEEAEHARAERIARAALEGRSEDPTGGANMFHDVSVKPSWTRKAEGKGRIGDLLFWRLEDR